MSERGELTQGRYMHHDAGICPTPGKLRLIHLVYNLHRNPKMKNKTAIVKANSKHRYPFLLFPL